MLRKVNSTIILHRKGMQEVHEPGAVVDLTESEYNDLRKINPECLTQLSEAEVALIEKQADAAAANKKPAAKKATSGKEAGEGPGEGEGEL